MAGSVFIRAEELAQELGISKQLAYKMIHKWNDELKKKIRAKLKKADPKYNGVITIDNSYI